MALPFAVDTATLRSIPFTLFFSLVLAGVFAYDIFAFIRTYGLFPMRICYLHVRKLIPPFNFAIFHHASIAHLVVSLMSFLSKATTLEAHYGTVPFMLLFALLASANAFTIRSLNALVKHLLSRSVNINPAYCISGITATLLSLKVLAARYMSADDRFHIIPGLISLPKIFIWLEPLVLRYLLPSQCVPLVTYWFALLFGFIALGFGHLSDAALAGKLGEAVKNFAARIAAILNQLASLTNNAGGGGGGGGGGGEARSRPAPAAPAAEKAPAPSDGMERRGGAQDFAGVDLAGLPTMSNNLSGMNQFTGLRSNNGPEHNIVPGPSAPRPDQPSAKPPSSHDPPSASAKPGRGGGGGGAAKKGRGVRQNRARASEESHEGKHGATVETSSSSSDDDPQSIPRIIWPQNAATRQMQQGDHQQNFSYDTRVTRNSDPYYINRPAATESRTAGASQRYPKPPTLSGDASPDGIVNRRMPYNQLYTQPAESVRRWNSQDNDKPNINWDFIESRAQRSLHEINQAEIERASSMLAAHDVSLNNIAERFGKEGAFHAYRARRLGQQQQQAGQQFALERTPYRWRL